MLGTIRENFQALSSMELEPPSEKDIETINDVAELEKMVSSHTKDLWSSKSQVRASTK